MQCKQWFRSAATVAEVKKAFRKLAKENHPDQGGDTAVMREIIECYHAALKMRDGEKEVGSDGKDHAYYYNEYREGLIVEVVRAVVRLDGVEVRIIGNWVWVTGETRKHRAALKSAGLRWHSKRAAWYWRPKGSKSRYNKSASLDDLAAVYGEERPRARGEKREEKRRDIAGVLS